MTIDTLAQKREFFIGKHLSYSKGKEDETYGEISDLVYSKIKDSYSINAGEYTDFEFSEEEIMSLANGDTTERGYYVGELQGVEEGLEDKDIKADELEFEGELLGENGQSWQDASDKEITDFIRNNDVDKGVTFEDSNWEDLSEKDKQLWINWKKELTKYEESGFTGEEGLYHEEVRTWMKKNLAKEYQGLSLDDVPEEAFTEKTKKEAAELLRRFYAEEWVKSEPVVVVEEVPVLVAIINNPDYKYYALTSDNKIMGGFEYKEDARDFAREHGLRVVAKRDMPVEPNDNANWGNSTPEKQELEKRILMWLEEERKELADEDSVAFIAGNSEHNEDIKKETVVTIAMVDAYGNHILRKMKCALDYLMPHTHKALKKEYKKLEMFY